MDLKQARETALMNQSEVAKKLNVTRSYYNQIENGKRVAGISLKRKINEVLQTKIY